MEEIKSNNHECGWLQNARLHYLNEVENLQLGEYWKQYVAELASELCGMETDIGDAFIKKNELKTRDPLKILEEMTKSVVPSKLRKEKDMTALRKRVWNAQIKICMPMMEMERCSYIAVQYKLLQGVMSSEYWEDAAGEYKVLSNVQGEGEVGDPYELDLATLQKMANLRKRLVMYGTVSYAPFIRMNGNDKKRIAFISGLLNRLTHFRLCSPEELEILFDGHEKYLNR